MQKLQTLFIGQVFHDLPQTASTNEYASSILLSKNKPPEGTVVSTFHQFDGRGQIGSKWESGPGKNISLSIILYPEFLPVHQQFQLNQAISLAVSDLVAKHFPLSTKIKWPNDIYVGEEKIAGLLIQNTLHNNHLRSSVAGIGMNVNQTVFLSNPPNPTSFKLQTGKDFILEQLIADLCHSVEARYLQLKNGNTALLQEEYLRSLYRYQTEALFAYANGLAFRGTITGIDRSGKLEVSVNGKEETFDLREIRFL